MPPLSQKPRLIFSPLHCFIFSRFFPGRFFIQVFIGLIFTFPFIRLYRRQRLILHSVNSDIHLPLRLDKDFMGSLNSFRGKKWDKVA